MSDDERAIRNVIATWLRASTAGDVDTILDLMAEDVVFLVPGRPPFGKEAFEAARNAPNDFRLEAQSEVREVRVLGDWAYAWTHLEVVMTPASGGPAVRRSGHTLSIFQRVSEGRWVLARDANMLAVDAARPAGAGDG